MYRRHLHQFQTIGLAGYLYPLKKRKRLRLPSAQGSTAASGIAPQVNLVAVSQRLPSWQRMNYTNVDYALTVWSE